MSTKSQQLQIRVTSEQKAALRRLARSAGQDVSSYVLSRALPEASARFTAIVRALAEDGPSRFALAELNDVLASLTPEQLRGAVADGPREIRELSPFLMNYVAAMVEQASHMRGVPPPSWVGKVPLLEEPYFATLLLSLRLHLLRAAPLAFKRRNLFVDAGVGDRV